MINKIVKLLDSNLFKCNCSKSLLIFVPLAVFSYSHSQNTNLTENVFTMKYIKKRNYKGTKRVNYISFSFHSIKKCPLKDMTYICRKKGVRLWYLRLKSHLINLFISSLMPTFNSILVTCMYGPAITLPTVLRNTSTRLPSSEIHT